MEVDYICGERVERLYGVARYEQEINKRITGVQFNRIDYQPLWRRFAPAPDRVSTIDGGEERILAMYGGGGIVSAPDRGGGVQAPNSFTLKMASLVRSTLQDLDGYRYQRRVKGNIKKDNIKHLTSQELGYLVHHIPPEKTIINCHDLIPWVYDQERSRRWRSNLEGMTRAGKIITVSQFSKEEITSHLNYPEEDIQVIPDAVDPDHFHPQAEPLDRARWGGVESDRYLLYVGSETPRMNLRVLLEALAKLKNLIPGVKLLKIGEAQSYGAREILLKKVKDLELERDVIFLGYVAEKYLPGFYRTAEVLVYPCLYAGFGLPPLEAMACGTPVITSNTSSLPEVVGDAGLMFNPQGVDELVTKLYEVLTYQKLREKLVKRGLERARMFSWEESAEKTLKLYKLLEQS